MLKMGYGLRLVAFGVTLSALSPIAAPLAHAATAHPTNSKSTSVSKSAAVVKTASHSNISSKSAVYLTHGSNSNVAVLRGSRTRYASTRYHGGGISCVPFARVASGIDVKGNAANWWDNAAGVYARGQAPESGSVLNFRANGHMRLGHVAVVTRVINSREIEIDHANWWGPGANRGGVSRSVPVVDVSTNNDWSAVRVGLGHEGQFGSVYPTYGFIYDRPDTGYASNSGAASFGAPAYDEVAEAPARSFR